MVLCHRSTQRNRSRHEGLYSDCCSRGIASTRMKESYKTDARYANSIAVWRWGLELGVLEFVADLHVLVGHVCAP
eukprot:5164996-Amphidinium_carterae.1